ncbi:hypothetical protein [Planctomycetes bacterium SV_7m_r]|uniref:hypothetical protein n=1 Tax=Stieleria bergensis TaxID=2528025 RepID=UPI0011AAFCCF
MNSRSSNQSMGQVNVIYLCEREIGSDNTEIGFPSIDGCRAIVLGTAGGLYGLHLNGSLNGTKLDALANFVNGAAVTIMYVACNQNSGARDIEEVAQVAARFGCANATYWLTTGFPGSSAYIDFMLVPGNKCVIQARAWNEAADNVPANKSGYAAGANRAMANGGAPGQMYAGLSRAGMTTYYPIKLNL